MAHPRRRVPFSKFRWLPTAVLIITGCVATPAADNSGSAGKSASKTKASTDAGASGGVSAKHLAGMPRIGRVTIAPSPVHQGPMHGEIPVCPNERPILCASECCAIGDGCEAGRCIVTRQSPQCPMGQVACGPRCYPSGTTCTASGDCASCRSAQACQASGAVDCKDGTCCRPGDLCGKDGGCGPNLNGPSQPTLGGGNVMCTRCPDVCCAPDVNDGMCVEDKCVRADPVEAHCPDDAPTGCGDSICCPDGVKCGDCGCPESAPFVCGNDCSENESLCAADGQVQACPDDHPVACGDGCCLPGAECVDGQCDCPASDGLQCGDVCCPMGTTSCNGDQCQMCPDDAPTACGDDTCCARGQECSTCPGDSTPTCHSGPCPQPSAQCGAGTFGCVGTCCPNGDTCCPSGCCPAGSTCDDSGHCAIGGGTGSGQCGAGRVECNGECCASGFVCCVAFGVLECATQPLCD